ncbi:sigma-70 family RNA polymerase sigma factor [Lentibacillus salicampi]|uniref:sigma-70 family RNA polymerase sigma factor n=1 Tax=Lentibacillus salicampi TaxID=175306 RepID=UPI003158DF2D
MRNAYENYQPDQGPMATYFNYTIRNRMIDLVRKQNKEAEKTVHYAQEYRTHIDNGNYYRSNGLAYPVRQNGGKKRDAAFWQTVREQLSDNQWKWVKCFIVEEMSVKEIAEQEGVSVEAVKSWGKQARRKLGGLVDEKALGSVW